MVKYTLLPAVIISLCLTGAIGYAQSLKDSIELCQKELDSTERKIEELTQIGEELAKKEQLSLARLEAIKEKIYLTERLIAQLRAQINRRNREINEITAELAQINKRIQQKREELSNRLVSIYKYSRLYPLQAMLTSENLPELYRRTINLRLVSRTDRKLLAELQELNQAATAQRESLLTARKNLDLLFEETKKKQEALSLDREEEARLLAKIQREKEVNKKAQQELENAKERLRSLIAQLEKREKETEGSLTFFEEQKGKLPWPIPGSVIATFGAKTHPRYRTKTANLGIDIKPQNPGSVLAIAAGKVVYADRFIGYGNLIIVDHQGGFYTLYANLSTIQTVVGAQVSTGTVLGWVEDYLHFEIRKNGQPINPLEWLQKER
ncbi:MAG: peptidoglycan DD-metalloendopeptidase family protein [candidate division WOR-3 bacterium]